MPPATPSPYPTLAGPARAEPEVRRGRGVSDVVAVVTRWFGGVLLGTGGSSGPTPTPCTRRRTPRRSCGTGPSSSSRSRSITPTGRLENALRGDPAVEVTDVTYGATGRRDRVDVDADGTRG